MPACLQVTLPGMHEWAHEADYADQAPQPVLNHLALLICLWSTGTGSKLATGHSVLVYLFVGDSHADA